MVYIPTRKKQTTVYNLLSFISNSLFNGTKNSITVLIYLNIFLLSNNQLVLLSDKTYLTKLIAQVMLWVSQNKKSGEQKSEKSEISKTQFWILKDKDLNSRGHRSEISRTQTWILEDTYLNSRGHRSEFSRTQIWILEDTELNSQGHRSELSRTEIWTLEDTDLNSKGHRSELSRTQIWTLEDTDPNS